MREASIGFATMIFLFRRLPAIHPKRLSGAEERATIQEAGASSRPSKSLELPTREAS